MKTYFTNSPLRHPRSQGSAVIVVLAFLAIMVLLVSSNTKTINSLRAEVRLANEKQIKRLAASQSPAVATNPAPVATP